MSTTPIPFARQRDTGCLVDIYEVPRGKHCNCECPSCGIPVLARQGEQREWHFAHSTADASGADTSLCKYSAFVSIRLMAQQLLSDIDTLRLPHAPGETDLNHRTVDVGGIEVGGAFEGVPVDAVVTIKGAPLVLYMTHPSREVPPALFALDGDRVGALRIALDVVPRFFDSPLTRDSNMRLDRETLRNWLQAAVESKSWIYHPRQKLIRAQNERRRKVSANAVDSNRPLIAKYVCHRCKHSWMGGYDDETMRTCLTCRSSEQVDIQAIP